MARRRSGLGTAAPGRVFLFLVMDLLPEGLLVTNSPSPLKQAARKRRRSALRIYSIISPSPDASEPHFML